MNGRFNWVKLLSIFEDQINMNSKVFWVGECIVHQHLLNSISDLLTENSP